MIDPPPKLRLGNRYRRIRKAQNALSQSAEPLRAKVRAAAALLGTNYRVNQGVQMAKTILGVPNSRNTNLKNLGESIKRSLKLSDPLNASTEIKNKTLRTTSNYVAMKLGYTNSTNTDAIYRLIQKIMRIKQNMNAATNNASRQRIGNELGMTLGKLILSYSKLNKGTGNGRGKIVTKGFINGIMTEILGARMAATVMKTIDWVLWTKNIYKNPELSYWNKYRKFAEPNRFARQVQRP
jgi:hypothetical protein